MAKYLEGLKGLPSIQEQERLKAKQQEEALAFLKAVNTASPKDLLNAYTTKPVEDITLDIAQTDWGASKYDKNITRLDQIDNINEFRAQSQRPIEKLGNGTGKMLTLAATTAIDGTLGLLYGVGSAISHGDIGKLWDNEVSNALSEFNDTMEKVLPNYKTQYRQDRKWYENLDSMDFWADSFLKNMGFMVGAMVPGISLNKVLKATGLLKSGLAAQFTGGIFSGINEARIEANHNSNDWEKAQIELANQALEKGYTDIISNNSLSAQDKADLLNQLETMHISNLESVKTRKANVGLVDFLANSVLLSVDNVLTFGKLYSQGFNTAKKAAKKAGSRVTRSDVREAAEKASLAESKGIKKEAGKYTFDEITKGKAALKGLGHGLREGHEEIAQQFFANLSGEVYSPDSPDAYYDALTNEDATIKTQEFLDATTKAFQSSYGNIDQYEQFAVGFLTGLLGAPTFGRSTNSTPNTWIGSNKPVGWSGGIIGEMKSAKEFNRETQDAVNYMNSYMDKYKNNRDHFIQSTAFTDAMNGYAAEQNAFEFKNAQDNEDFVAISRFASVGKLQDLKDMISLNFEDLTDEELKNINLMLSSNGESRWDTTNDTGLSQMREDLIEKRDNVINNINKYEEALNVVNNLALGDLSYHQKNELAWLYWKREKLNERFNSLRDQYKYDLISLRSGIGHFKNENVDHSENGEKIRKILDSLESGIRAVGEAKNAIHFANILKEYKDLYNALFSTDPLFSIGEEKVTLKDLIKNNTDGLSYDKLDSFYESIQDIAKLAKATEQFDLKYKEYKDNPIKVSNKREEKKQKAEEARRRQDIADKASKLEDIPTPDLARAYNNGKIDDEVLNSLENKVDVEKLADVYSSIDASLGAIAAEAQMDEDSFKELSEGLKSTFDTIPDPGEVDGEISVLLNDPIIEESIEMALRSNSVDGSLPPELLDEVKANIHSRLSQDVKTKVENIKELEEIPNPFFGESDLSVADEETNSKDPSPSANTISIDNKEMLKTILAGIDANPSQEEAILNILKDPTDNNIKEQLESAFNATDQNVILMRLEEIFTIESEDTRNSITPTVTAEQVGNEDLKESNYSYWRINTTYYPIDYSRGELVPFYTRITEEEDRTKVQKVYDYLLNKGAYTRVDKGEIKKGDVIKFIVDPELFDENNAPVVLIANGKGEVIGDLASTHRMDRTTIDRQEGLQEFNERVISSYLEFAKDNPNTVYTFPETSTVEQVFVGKIPYTKPYNTLNTIFGDGNFKLAIVSNSSSMLYGLEKGGIIEGVRLPKNIKPGTPYLLFPTNSTKYKYVTVPISMPTMDVENHKDFSLYKDILNTVSKLASSDSYSKLKDTILNLKSQIVIPGQIYGKINNNGGITIWYKPSNSDKTVTIFNGNKEVIKDDPDAVLKSIVKKVQNTEGITPHYNIRVSGLTNNNYLKKVGELASTNLPIGIQHTVSNWFSLKPVLSSSTGQKNTAKKGISEPQNESAKIDYKGTKAIMSKLDSLSDDNKKEFNNLTPAQKKQFVLSLSSVTKKQVNEAFKRFSNEKNRLADRKTSIKLWDPSKELKWLDKVLPQISQEDKIAIHKGLIKIAENRFAWGQFRKGVIIISDVAAKGTLYHEAFHSVVNTLLDEKERTSLFKEAEKEFKLTNELELEEVLAENFRRYVQYENIPIIGKIIHYFRKIKNYINTILNNAHVIDTLYYRINSGAYANRQLLSSSDIKNSEISDADRQSLEESFKYTKNIITRYYKYKGYQTRFDAENEIAKEGLDPRTFAIERIPEKERIGDQDEYRVVIVDPFETFKATLDFERKISAFKEDYDLSDKMLEEADLNELLSVERIREYHRNKYNFASLPESAKLYIEATLGITEEEYDSMSSSTKEVVNKCAI